ncbi:MAG: AraC family transcriptional regulator [Clostridia bacterium]|nr:AraC family transcriptional regulator [Clostridia bacterium]
MKYRNPNNISHYHSDYELVYINEGNATVAINENIFHLNPGKCVFIHSNDIHYIQSGETSVITVLKAENKYFESIFASKKLLSPIVNKPSSVAPLLHHIYAELNSRIDNSDAMADSISAQLLITLLRSEETVSCESIGAKKANTSELYREICGKISNEYDTITFEEAARYMHFSEPYFSKVFHKLFGMTFTQYLNTIRIAEAIEMLKKGDLSITEISASCGFNTIRNFNRVFKNFTGYTPGNLPQDYVFLYNLQEDCGLDPTLTCTEILSCDSK